MSRRCCCGDCDWINETFDSGSVTDDWTGDTSDWSISSGVLQSNQTNSILLHKTAYPRNAETSSVPMDGAQTISDHYHRHNLYAKAKAADADRVLLFIVAAADTSNYIALELTVGYDTQEILGKARLIDVTAGVTTQISQTHYFRDVVAGDWLHVTVEFNDGIVRAVVSDTDAYLSDPGEPDISTWQRELRSQGTSHTYHGDYVGVGVGAGTGYAQYDTVVAGCRVVKEFCILEQDEGWYTSASWKSDAWELISGTLPSRFLGAGECYLRFDSGAAMMLHRNPILDTYEDDHAVSGEILVIGTFPDGGNAKLLLACDDAGSNGLAIGVTRLGTLMYFALYELVAGSYSVLTSGVEAYSSGPETAIQLLACIQNGRLYGSYSYDDYDLSVQSGTLGAATTAAAGNRVGVDVGTTDLTLEDFSSFRVGPINSEFTSWYDVCQYCSVACSECSGGVMAAEVLIEFPDGSGCTPPLDLGDRYAVYTGTACCLMGAEIDYGWKKEWQLTVATSGGTTYLTISWYESTDGAWGGCGGSFPVGSLKATWKVALTGDDLDCTAWNRLEVPSDSGPPSCAPLPSAYVTATG